MVIASRRTVTAAAGLLLGALAVLASPAAPAQAHAVLSSATPTQGSVIASVPTAVQLTFSEPVAIVPGKTQVIAPDGKRINDGDPVAAAGGLRIALRGTDRPLGTYLVSYRIISADSHPISGAFTFSVGAPSRTAPPSAVDSVHPAVDAAIPVVRYVGYVALALVVGPILFLAVLWPRRLGMRGPRRLVVAGLGVLGASTLAGLWLQAPYTSGAAPFDVSGVELRQVLTSQYGLALLARLAVIAAVAVLLGRALRRRTGGRYKVILAVLAVAGLATWPLSGHQIASPRPWLTTAGDMVHLASMAVWLGGLVVLAGFLLRRADPRELGVILPVWSRWATIAVYWLVAGGVAQALIEVGVPRKLIDTDYGRLILFKTGLLAAVLAVAALSRHLVRRRANVAGTPKRLRRSVAVEVGIAAVVLVASSVLVQTTPGRTDGLEAAAAEQAEGFSTTLTSPLYSVQFEIFPVQLGENNTLHAFVYTPEGKPLDVAQWTVTAALPDRGIEPIDNPVVTIRGNQGIGAITFPLAGQWQLRLTIRVSDVDQATVTTTVPVR